MICTNTLYIRVLRLVPALKYNLKMHERPVSMSSLNNKAWSLLESPTTRMLVRVSDDSSTQNIRAS